MKLNLINIVKQP